MKVHGIAGRIAQSFVQSKLTPVFGVFSILLGLASVVLTPKEEEPQISVPMIDISVVAPGLEAEEIERKVSEPIERAVWGLDGVEYVYSASQAHGSLVTVRFKVGEPIEPSLVKIHHKLMEIKSQLPLQAADPQVRSLSVDDVPFLTMTFSSRVQSAEALRTMVAPLAREFSSTPDLAKIELLGGSRRVIRIRAEPKKLEAKGVSLLSVAKSLSQNQSLLPAGKNWGKDSVLDVDVGGRLANAIDVGKIAIGQRGGQVVRLSDVANITDGPEELTRSSMIFEKGNPDPAQAVSIVFTKRKGTNVVELSDKLLTRSKEYSKGLSPEVTLTPIRDYGTTAEQKSKELIEHLLIATLSVSILIALFMGIRAALVVAIAIPVTLALTLAVYYFLGYTLNRITLFALIFSIGILVDDAIVVVENIERHFHLDRKSGVLKAILQAVSEVGNPTILATFTVIAAILPMAFVQGMMGPYMKPIPVGATLAMLISLWVAFMVTPWAAMKLMKAPDETDENAGAHNESKIDRIYRRLMTRLLSERKAALGFGVLSIALLILSGSLLYFRAVKVKMLPFDNKNEFQVTLDYPADTPILKNIQMSQELAKVIMEHPEVKAVQMFVGEAAPFSFSGMVKHTFLRGKDDQSDLQVLLTSKDDRSESSHQIIESLRPQIREFSARHRAVSKVLEIPPGPPVLATMLAEVYGPNRESREAVAADLERIFRSEPSVVDLDTTLRMGRPRTFYSFNYDQAGVLGGNAEDVAHLGRLLFSETRMGALNEAVHPEEIPLELSVQNEFRSGPSPFEGQQVPSFESGVFRADRLLQKQAVLSSPTLYRKNLKPVSYVMSELSGSEEAPVYGMLKLSPQIKVPTQTAEVPWDTRETVIKWDGEWFITYEVFRDLGGAFAVVLILIYVLVLGWFKSYSVPLIIMAPIPLSLIGILPGHAILNGYFTATSMIGFIAGAGIIVRNSIILVDFIEQQIREGQPLKEAVIGAGVLRFRPMLLTAAAVVVGSAVMLADPIFQGLAISLMFGEIAATLLSRFAVPVLYYWSFHRKGKM